LDTNRLGDAGGRVSLINDPTGKTMAPQFAGHGQPGRAGTDDECITKR